jgi:murein DD-endopeptidase MepM/ murein hydrolase activator NlpD
VKVGTESERLERPKRLAIFGRLFSGAGKWVVLGTIGAVIIGGMIAIVSANNASKREAEQKQKEKQKTEQFQNQTTDNVKKNDESWIVDYETCAKVYETKLDGQKQVCFTKDGRSFSLSESSATSVQPAQSSRTAATSSNTTSSSNTTNTASQPNLSDTNQTSSTTSNPTPDSPQSTPPSLPKLGYKTIITPYVNESDIISANEAYSLDANNPYWGFSHPGVDFMADHTIDVQASISGTIGNLTVAEDPGQMGWHAGFCIDTATESSVCYNLETFSHDATIHDQLVAGLRFSNGTHVNQGDVIAQLVFGGSGAHIDFGVTKPGTRVCPEPYFTDAARESVLRIIHILQPTWPMCYP